MKRFTTQTTSGAENLDGYPEPVLAMLNEALDRVMAEQWFMVGGEADDLASFAALDNGYADLVRQGQPPQTADDLIAYLNA